MHNLKQQNNNHINMQKSKLSAYLKFRYTVRSWLSWVLSVPDQLLCHENHAGSEESYCMKSLSLELDYSNATIDAMMLLHMQCRSLTQQ